VQLVYVSSSLVDQCYALSLGGIPLQVLVIYLVKTRVYACYLLELVRFSAICMLSC
jgi:hypothetical protein